MHGRRKRARAASIAWRLTPLAAARSLRRARYWLAAGYEARLAAGQEPHNVDKEFLRRWFVERCDPYKDAQLPDVPPELTCELSRR